MISYLSAIEILKNRSKNHKEVTLPLAKCLHLQSVEDVFAPINVPAFDNSAMDGYAFRYEDYQNDIALRPISEIQAGTNLLLPIGKGEAARIFTGAPIPENADTVIPQENVLVENGMLKIQKPIEKNANIRRKGTQTQRGALILKSNTRITAEYIGFLATFGISELKVYSPPKIGIIVTGKELVKAGSPLQAHQIYESNAVFLTAALLGLGIEPAFSLWVDDRTCLNWLSCVLRLHG